MKIISMLGMVFVLLIGCVLMYIYIWYPLLFPPAGGPAVSVDDQMEAICAKVATFVDDHPELGELTLNDLVKHNAISGEQKAAIETYQFQFNPISAASPDHAVVLERKSVRAGHRYRFHKRYGKQSWYAACSDEQAARYAFFYPSHGCKELKMQRILINNQTWNELFTYESNGTAVAEWNDSGTILVVVESREKTLVDFLILMPDGDRVICRRLNDELDPCQVLSMEFRKTHDPLVKQNITNLYWRPMNGERPECLGFSWRAEFPCKDPTRVAKNSTVECRLRMSVEDRRLKLSKHGEIETTLAAKKQDEKIRHMTRIEREEWQRRQMTPAQREALERQIAERLGIDTTGMTPKEIKQAFKRRGEQAIRNRNRHLGK